MRHSVNAPHVTGYGHHLLELGSRGLTCFPHGGETSTTNYLLGPLAFISRVQDFMVPPPPLGADHSYLSFNISRDTPVIRATPILPRIRVHFDHALDPVNVSHLT